MKHRGWFARSIGLLWILIFAGVGSALIRPAGVAQAHSTQGGAVYVAPFGRDGGHCDDVRRPCQTIRYAIDHVLREGQEVRVAAGEYTFDPKETVLLLSKMIAVKGGYTQANGFSAQDPARYQTILVGPSTRYREQLRARGFVLAQDLNGTADVPLPDIESQSPTTRTNCVNGLAGVYPCDGIDLMARIPLNEFSAGTDAASNIWGFVDLNDQHEYTLIGLNNGTGVVDVTDPENPRRVGFVPSTNDSSWRELRVYQFFDQGQNRWKAYGYVVSDVVGSPGIQVIDLTGLPNSVSLAATYTGLQRQHTVYLSNTDYSTGVPISGTTPYLYVNGANTTLNRGAFRVFSVANPTQIQPISTPTIDAQYTHDGTSMLITDSRASACRPGHNPCEIYIDYNENTVDIWDATDKSSLLRISSTPYTGAQYTHSGWWTEDKRYVFIQDELDEQQYGHNSRLRTLDISNLASPRIVASWDGPTKAIDHNGYSKRGLYYMSNYRRGLTILDITNPKAVDDVAFFDTFVQSSTDSANFNGAWGVYPYFPSGTIVVSDIEGGLFILRESPQAITGLTASSDSPALVGETIAFSATVDTGTNVTYSWNFGDQTTGTGGNATHQYATAGSYQVTVTATNGLTTKTKTITAVIEPNVPPQQHLFLPQLTIESGNASGRGLPAAPIGLMLLLACLGVRGYARRRG